MYIGGTRQFTWTFTEHPLKNSLQGFKKMGRSEKEIYIHIHVPQNDYNPQGHANSLYL